MRIIGHLDMDAFFAAIEERDHPELAGQPLVVGAGAEPGLQVLWGFLSLIFAPVISLVSVP